MNRKQFIESQGATCRNWTWSWSFVNESERFVIFGIWDVLDEGGRGCVFADDWAISLRGKHQPGWGQSREHLRLIEEEGYTLKVFPMQKAPDDPDDPGAPWKIASFTPVLYARRLERIGQEWFASGGTTIPSLPEEVGSDEALIEGAVSTVLVNSYERNPIARDLSSTSPSKPREWRAL